MGEASRGQLMPMLCPPSKMHKNNFALKLLLEAVPATRTLYYKKRPTSFGCMTA